MGHHDQVDMSTVCLLFIVLLHQMSTVRVPDTVVCTPRGVRGRAEQNNNSMVEMMTRFC
jgi:hypothetical protein